MLSHYDLRRNFPNGDRYTGEATENNVKDGKGTYFWAETGATYTGEWKKDAMHGTGKLDVPAGPAKDGFSYTGRFDSGLRHGQGKCDFADGRTYEGAWLRGSMDGKGSLRCPAGNLDDFIWYTGTFLGGRRHGSGECAYKDNSHYVGEWLEDRRHGAGVLHTPTERYFGPFLQDSMTGDDALWAVHDPQCPDRCVSLYAGSMLRGNRHGQGVLYNLVVADDASVAAETVVKQLSRIPAADVLLECYAGSFCFGARRGEGRWLLVDLSIPPPRGSSTPRVMGLVTVSTAQQASQQLTALQQALPVTSTHSKQFAGQANPAVIAQFVGEWDSDRWSGAGTLHSRPNIFFVGSAPSRRGWSVVRYMGGFTGCRFDGDGVAHFEHGGRLEGSFRMGLGTGVAKAVNMPLCFPCWVGSSHAPLLPDEALSPQRHAPVTDELEVSGVLTSRSIRLDYAGAVCEGVFHGDGKAELFLNGGASKWCYEGQWHDGAPHGEGTITIKSVGRRGATTTVKGEFADGLPHGECALIVEDGMMRAQYSGGFVEGQRSGIGRSSLGRQTANGLVEPVSHYVGSWARDLYNGHGTFQDAATSDSYTGEWLDGRRHGASGCVAIEYGKSHYTGGFRNDRKHGTGTLKLSDGRKYEGAFVNDEFHGKGRLQLADGVTHYAGEFVTGQVHGHAEVELANGNRYEGNFVHGIIQGEGEMRYINGDRFVGSFVAGERRGQGKLHFAGGGVLTATWNPVGLLHGDATFEPPAIPNAPPPSRRRYEDGVLVSEEPALASELSPVRKRVTKTEPPTRLIAFEYPDIPTVPSPTRDVASPSRDDAPSPHTGRPSNPLRSSVVVPMSFRKASAVVATAPTAAGHSDPGSPDRAADNFAVAPMSRMALADKIYDLEQAIADCDAQLAATSQQSPQRRVVQRKLALLRATKLREQQKLARLDTV
jgi:hypothetical protein